MVDLLFKLTVYGWINLFSLWFMVDLMFDLMVYNWFNNQFNSLW